MRRVLVRTFGCKLNQYESQFISESFASRGYCLAVDEVQADIHVINTCSVTARTDSEARQFIRRALRANPGALIVATGCYAQRAPSEIAEIGGVGLVAGNAEKSCLPRLVEELSPCTQGAVERAGSGAAVGALRCGPESQRRSRALVKIQDGCDGSCSYCVVPSVRGKSRSEPPERIAEEVGLLEAWGFREVVLTGARVGSYGSDLGEGHSLENLLKRLLDSSDGLRFRLSSLEPLEIGTSLLELVAGEERVCAHFHVPLQSADEDTLCAMQRPYSPSEYSAVIRAIRSLCPEACIGADVMAGFPGEGESAFAETHEFIDGLPLSYLHVFPFSRRPGTDACSMQSQCPDSSKRTRAAALRALGQRKKIEFIESQTGTVQDVVLEKEIEKGVFTASTGNYLRVEVKAEGRTRGERIRIKTRSGGNGRLVGEPC
jgi:threonylcarbamoyladenosine tRNA methylthiotransferase MtaB